MNIAVLTHSVSNSNEKFYINFMCETPKSYSRQIFDVYVCGNKRD